MTTTRPTVRPAPRALVPSTPTTPIGPRPARADADAATGPGRAAEASGERGMALLTVLMVTSVILFLGTFAFISSRSEIRTSANYRGRIQAQYFAESGMDLTVGYQNDLSGSPRYLFDPNKYSSMSADSSVFKDLDAKDPATGKKVGTIRRVIVGKNPASQPPPYTLRSTATLLDGSQATYEVEIDALSLLDFAMYSEGSLTYVPPGTWYGRTYINGNFKITGGCPPPEVFMKKVEYTGTISGQSCGDFREGVAKIDPYPSLTSLVDLDFYEDAVTNSNVCGAGMGLYIGNSGSSAVKSQSNDLFGMKDTGKRGVDKLDDAAQWLAAEDEAVTGCMNADDCYQIDLTLFDFAANPITYGGKQLVGWNGAKLTPASFNGVIFVDGELHIWGILGGRSPEDAVVVDRITSYDSNLYRATKFDDLDPATEKIGSSLVTLGKPFHHHPKFSKLALSYLLQTSNHYSNNALDAGEDANGNGILDAAKRGRTLTIVTEKNSDIVIDHNIYYGEDAFGNRVSLGLIAGDAMYVDPSSPRALVATGALLARGYDTWDGWDGSFMALPKKDQTTHRLNLWAKGRGDVAPTDSTYVYDLDGDGTIETDIGQGQSGDRNEKKMRDAWVNLDLGNMVTAESASWGPWVSTPHAGVKIYDFGLIAAEPPCWPVLPYYGMVAGSFVEQLD
jgi:hypothetical protein